MRYTRSSAVTAVAVLAAVAGGVGTAGTASADAPTPLALPHYSHMAVDAAHGHVFVSGGEDSTGVAVTDLDGAAVGALPDEPGATALALSPDGGTLYIALPGSDAVSAVDTATLAETARYSTGSGPQDDPQYLAYAGGRLWFGYGSDWNAGIGSIDTGADHPVATLHGGGWFASPALAASPAAPNVLVAGDTGESAAPLKAYDVSSGVPVVTASTSVETNLGDMAISPDGRELVVATGAPYHHQILRLADLTAAGGYPTSYYPDSVAIAADGTVAAGVDAGSPNLYVFAQDGSTPLQTFDVRSGGGSDLPTAALAWQPDGSRLFAVTTDAYGENPQLHVLREPRKAASFVSLPAGLIGYPHTPLTLAGSLQSDAPYTGTPVLHVSRADAAHPGGLPLPDVTAGPDGSFSFTDTPAATGDVTYTVTYPGDAGHAADTESTLVSVFMAPATVVLGGPDTAHRGKPVRLTGTLTSPAPFAPGEIVHVSRKDAQHTVALPDARIGADGSFSFTDTPRVGGIVDYTASYPGDAAHVASFGNHEVQVSPRPARTR